jgi:2-iminobutanoate/2-iminopropanoate deaminase
MIRNPSRRMVRLICAVLAVAWFATVPTLEHPAAQQPQQRHNFQSAGPLAGLPFSDAVLVGNTLYVAGHIGVDNATGQAPASLDQEIQLLLEQFRATVAQAGMKMDNLVSVNVYSTDLSLYDKFNTAYRTQFSKDFPARAFVGVAALLRGAHFEMEGVAVK